MSSTPPSASNGYQIPLDQVADRAFFQSVFTSLHARLQALELTEADYDAAIDAITTQALAIVSATISEEIEDQRAVLAQTRTAVTALLAEYEAVATAGLPAAKARLDPIPGFAPTNLQAAIQALFSREPLSLLPPIIAAPAPNATPTLVGNALVLAVDRLYSLYQKTQKTLRFRVATDATFQTIVHDTGVVATTAFSMAVPNAGLIFNGGVSYVVQAIQTDQDNASSGWGAPSTFTFPKVPAAPTMSAPANGATGVGAQNAAITLTAAAYAHPNGVAQAARRFELSRDSFANIVTVAGTVGAASATIANPKDVLVANADYAVRAVDTDVNGGVAVGAATTFRTVAAFRPNIGDAYQGGFYVGQIKDGGTVYDLIVAPKSGGETSLQHAALGDQESPLRKSRSNGPLNTNSANGAGSTASPPTANNSPASFFCYDLVLNGYDDWYLPAIDELEVAYRNLKPTTNQNSATVGANANAVPPSSNYTSDNPAQTVVAAFRSGGSEAFGSGAYYQSSTETSMQYYLGLIFHIGAQAELGKNGATVLRAFRRVAA